MLTEKKHSEQRDSKGRFLPGVMPDTGVQFQPGKSGNNKGYSLTSELKDALDKETRAEIIKSTIEGAIKREVTPFKEVWDRVEGKVQSEGEGDVNIQINIVTNIPRPEV